MKRKAYIKFDSKHLVTITTFALQKNFDLSKIVHKRIDLIELKVKDSASEFYAEVLPFEDDYYSLRISSISKNRYREVGSAQLGSFEYYFSNPSNDYSQNVNDGTFETTIL